MPYALRWWGPPPRWGPPRVRAGPPLVLRSEQERRLEPISLILFKAIGAFFAIEGGANMIYWRLFGRGVKDNDYWQIGRMLRAVLGIVLVVLG